FTYDDLKFPEKQSDNEFLPHLWAMRRVGHLLDQIRLNGESKELRDEVVDLGTRYGIVTPYTSYLVLESSERRPMLSSMGPGAVGGIAGNSPARSRMGPEEARNKDRNYAPAPEAPLPDTEANAQRMSGQMDELAKLSAAARGSASAAGSDAVAFSK